MYVVTVHFHVKPDHVADFQAAMLVNARSAVEKEPGCRSFNVTVDENDPAHFFLFEVYDDVAAFEKHKTMDHFATVNRVIEPYVLDSTFAMFYTVG